MFTEEYRYFLAGLIAGEGCFHASRDDKTHSIQIKMHIRDLSVLEDIWIWIGGGSVRVFPKSPSFASYQFGGRTNMHEFVIPLMDKYLLGSFKRTQYLVWRNAVYSKSIRGRRPECKD